MTRTKTITVTLAMLAILSWTTSAWGQAAMGTGYGNSGTAARPIYDTWTELLYVGGAVQLGSGGGDAHSVIGSLRVGVGSTPDVALGDDDFFVEGTSEFDGHMRVDATIYATRFRILSGAARDGSDAYLWFEESSADSTPTSNTGQLYTKDNGGNTHLYYIGDGVAAIELSSAAGGNTLDQAYDQGGLGSGRTITATDGAVLITSTDADAAYLLDLTPTPSGSAALGGMAITLGANSTQDGISISHGAASGTQKDIDGTGGAWYALNSGVGHFKSLYAGEFDASSAETVEVGQSTATKLELADTLIETEIQGTLDVHEAANFVTDLSVAGNSAFGDAVTDTISFNGAIITNTFVDDGIMDTPQWAFQDGDNETAIFYKENSGNLHLDFSVATDGLELSVGNLFVGSTTPAGITANGDDGLIADDFEVGDRFDAYGDVTIDTVGGLNTMTVNAISAFTDQISVALGVNTEEIYVTTTPADYAAGSGVLTIYDDSTGQTVGVNYLNRLVREGDGIANDGFILCQDNSTGAIANGDTMFSVGSGGAVVIAGSLTVDTVHASTTTTDELNYFWRNDNASSTALVEIEVTDAADTGTALLIDHNGINNAYGIFLDHHGDLPSLQFTPSVARTGDVINTNMANQLAERGLVFTGAWTGTGGEGLVDLYSSGVLLGHMFRVDTDTAQAPAYDGYSIYVDDDSLVAAGPPQYAVLIDSNANEGMLVSTGNVTINDTLTVGNAGGGFVLGELLDMDGDANSETVTFTNSAADFGAAASFCSIQDSSAGQANPSALLALERNADGVVNDSFLIMRDNAYADIKVMFSPGGETDWTLDAAAKVNLDGSSTTRTENVLDVSMATITTNRRAIDVSAQMVAGGGGGEVISGFYVDMDDDSDAAGTFVGVNIAASDVTGASEIIGILVQSCQTAASFNATAAGQAVVIDDTSTSTTTDGALDVDGSSITDGYSAERISVVMEAGGGGNEMVYGGSYETDDDSDAAGELHAIRLWSDDNTGSSETCGLYWEGDQDYAMKWEGATEDGFEILFNMTDVGADYTVTFGSDTGYPILSAADVEAADGIWANASAFVFEGSGADGNETTLTLTNPTAARTITLPDASGYPILSSAAPEAANALSGASNALVYEGATADAHELSIVAEDPATYAQDATVTVPAWDGDLPMLISKSNTDSVAVGAPQTTDVDGSSISLPDGYFSAGKSLVFEMYGTCVGGNAAKSFILNVDGAAIVTLTTDAADTGDWHAKFVMDEHTDFANQKCFGNMAMESTHIAMDMADDTTDFNDGGATIVKLQIVSNNGGDTITVENCKVYLEN